MIIKTYDKSEKSPRTQHHNGYRAAQVKSMLKLTVICVTICVVLNKMISFRVYERFKVIPFSYTRNLYVKIDNNDVNLEHSNVENSADIVASIENKNMTWVRSDVQEHSSVGDSEQQVRKLFMKIRDQRVYIYSAFVYEIDKTVYSKMKSKKRKHEPTNFIALNGWRHSSSDEHLTCCYMHEDNKTITSAKTFGQVVHFVNASLTDVQYRCPQMMKIPKKIIGVTLTRKNSLCPEEGMHYISPTDIGKKQKKDIGVCTKLSYGSIKASSLVEWFEAMRFLGVDEIISYNSNLSPATQKVFDYYSSMGLLDSYPFELPEIDNYPRELGEKSLQAWTDEQVIINDCRLRLGAFKYAVFLDKDEILLPKKLSLNNSLRTYFNMLDDGITGQRFFSEIHLTDWRPFNPTHPLFIGKYTLRSEPVPNSVKFMFKPPFFRAGGCFAHNIYKLNGKRLKFAKDHQIAVHHFRSCDTDRLLFENGTFCRETSRSPSMEIKNLADALTKDVLDTLNYLNL